MMYSGDEECGDKITSGIFPDDYAQPVDDDCAESAESAESEKK